MGRPHFRLTRQETEIALGEDRHVLLGEEIGTGSTSTVFRAVLKLGWGIQRPIAVKVFDAVATDDRETVLATMAAAARAAASVHHPNIAQVLEFGVLEGARPYIFEDLVPGPSLAALTEAYDARGLRVPLDLALFLGVEVAEGLSGARTGTSPDGVRVGLVHGDLSSRDVLLSSLGEVKITDFGMAAATRAASSVRTFASVARRAETIAPEVVGGEEPNARSDVFSLGIMLWQMLIGRRFPKDIGDAQILAYAREGFVHTSVFDPQLPAALKTVLRRAIDPIPAKRYPHAGALAFELRRVALAMGVGDGRVFLKFAIKRMREDSGLEEAETTEMAAEAAYVEPQSEPPPPPVLRQPVSGTVRRAAPLPNE